jgi:hypothetical protein
MGSLNLPCQRYARMWLAQARLRRGSMSAPDQTARYGRKHICNRSRSPERRELDPVRLCEDMPFVTRIS